MIGLALSDEHIAAPDNNRNERICFWCVIRIFQSGVLLDWGSATVVVLDLIEDEISQQSEIAFGNSGVLSISV